MLKPFTYSELPTKFLDAWRHIRDGCDKYETEILGYVSIEGTTPRTAGGIMVVGVCSLKNQTRVVLIPISGAGKIRQYIYLPLEGMNGLQEALQSTALRAMVDPEPTPKRK